MEKSPLSGGDLHIWSVSYSDPYGLSADGCDKPVGKSEKIVCRTREKLTPWKPILDTAFEVLMFASPDPSGEVLFGMAVLSRVDNVAEVAIDVSRGRSLLDPVTKNLKRGRQHEFSTIVDNYADDASVFTIPTRGPGGKVVRNSELRQLKGTLNGEDGVFEWVIDQGQVTHRRFIPGGTVTGSPNQVVK